MALIALGVSGGIGAYKAVEIARGLQKQGHDVAAIMTRAARRFVGPLTFEAITRREVMVDQWKPGANSDIEHISLASSAALLLVAPATANIIGKFAAGDNSLQPPILEPPGIDKVRLCLYAKRVPLDRKSSPAHDDSHQAGPHLLAGIPAGLAIGTSPRPRLSFPRAVRPGLAARNGVLDPEGGPHPNPAGLARGGVVGLGRGPARIDSPAEDLIRG